jgi:uncharacterized repeat protein (TIGR01451 family)
VRDSLPDGVIFEDSTPSQGNYDASSGVWTVGNVAVGATPTLQISATVANTQGETNTAEISAADQPDSDSSPGNNSAAEDDQASAAFATEQADLSLAKSVDDATPNENQNVRFTLTLSNAGPNDASSVTVRDLLPNGLNFVSFNASTGTYDAASGLWTISNVPVDANPTLVIEASVNSSTNATNTAEIMSVQQFDLDSTPGNGAPGEDDVASATVTPPVVDIAVGGSVDHETPVEGDVITIIINTGNAGPVGATGLAVSAAIPNGLTILSAQPQSGSYNNASGLWTIGSLSAGDTTQLTITARVETRGQKTIPINVVSTDQFDSDSENNQTELQVSAPRVLSARLFLSR